MDAQAATLHQVNARRQAEVQAPAIRVLLADDHLLMRHSLRQLLESEQNIEVIAEAEDLDSVTKQVHSRRPHVLVLDMNMPNGSGIDSIRQLRRSAPDTQIVVLTMDDSPVFARQTLGCGALGHVLKEHADSDLPAAVRAAARSERYVSPGLTLPAEPARGSAQQQLTPREIAVLKLIALGHTNVETAGRLHLSPRTVEAHRARIFAKLGLSTRAQLVRFALEQGLLRA